MYCGKTFSHCDKKTNFKKYFQVESRPATILNRWTIKLTFPEPYFKIWGHSLIAHHQKMNRWWLLIFLYPLQLRNSCRCGKNVACPFNSQQWSTHISWLDDWMRCRSEITRIQRRHTVTKSIFHWTLGYRRFDQSQKHSRRILQSSAWRYIGVWSDQSQKSRKFTAMGLGNIEQRGKGCWQRKRIGFWSGTIFWIDTGNTNVLLLQMEFDLLLTRLNVTDSDIGHRYEGRLGGRFPEEEKQ